MRTDIFYWKCDSPIPVEQKKNQFFHDKYTPETYEFTSQAVYDFLGHVPEQFEIMKSDGNHLTATFSDGTGKFLFRADEGHAVEDDYILAESAVMNLLNKEGLSVPPVYHTDISMSKYPFRFQIMALVPYPCLNKFAKAGTLDEMKIAEQSGKFLAGVHNLHYPGYGFINTELLAKENKLRGLDNSAAEYFNKRLEDHISYLTSNGLIGATKEERIRNAFAKAMPLLDNVQSSLLHRDYAYWNILGTENSIEQVIDWDDTVSGDPADDFGIVNCFLSAELLEQMLKSYSGIRKIDDSFKVRIHLHTVRNMLWKTMIRHYMGYFDKGKDFFLSGGNGMSLKEYTLFKIDTELETLENML